MIPRPHTGQSDSSTSFLILSGEVQRSQRKYKKIELINSRTKSVRKLKGLPVDNRLLHPFQFLNSWRFPYQPPRYRVALLFANESTCAATLGHGGTKVLFHSLHYMYRRPMLPSTNLRKGNSSSDKCFQVLFICTRFKMMTLLLQVHTLPHCTLLAHDAHIYRVTW